MELKRLIFLDLDGVVASVEYLRHRRSGDTLVEPAKCELLNQLEGAEIVISSSWGYDGGKTEETLRDAGLKLPIVGYTTHVYQDWICRGNEIERWLQEHAGGMGTKWGDDYLHKNYQIFDYEYAIVDDNDDMLIGQIGHIVKTNEDTGLTQEDVDKIRKILKMQ